MTPQDLKRALVLYKRFQVTSWEYRELAAKYGMQITDLNRLCHRHIYPTHLGKSANPQLTRSR